MRSKQKKRSENCEALNIELTLDASFGSVAKYIIDILFNSHNHYKYRYDYSTLCP